MGAGFEVADAVALLRMSDLYIESFEVKDVKVRVQPVDAHSARLYLLHIRSMPHPLLHRLIQVDVHDGHIVLCLQCLQTLRGEHMSRCIGRLAGKVCHIPAQRQAALAT
jgi:hypothetical protein